MLIMALDPGRRSGVATGVAGTIPRVEAVSLRGTKDGPEKAPSNLGCFLRDRWSLEKPDLLVVESPLNPAASKSADATISQLFCHGAIHAIAGCYGVPVRIVPAATARVHFCGKSSAAPKRNAPRTPQQQREDREATNNMVLKRAIALRYLPHGCTDWDKASAACLWDWASATLGRAQPKELVMFGQTAEAAE
jgi:hypothetical protein